MNQFHKYASFIKLEHSLFSLPLFFAGALLGQGGWPSLRLLIFIVIAGISARNVAMIFNRIIDREIDRKNPRTKDRHLASGEMNLLEAWVLAFINLGIYLGFTYLISEFCFQISWIPLLAFGAYPFFKRFTKWAHVGLGLVWSMVPLAGFFAVQPSLKGISPVLLLSLFSVFWLAGFDIIYATLDEEFDLSEGLYSLPARWGARNALKLAVVFHLFAFLSLVALYGIWMSGPITLMLLVITGILLVIEHQFSNYVDLAFFKLNVVIGVAVMFFVLAGIKGV